jgi:hypothetical protein
MAWLDRSHQDPSHVSVEHFERLPVDLGHGAIGSQARLEQDLIAVHIADAGDRTSGSSGTWTLPSRSPTSARRMVGRCLLQLRLGFDSPLKSRR